ncbi:hypothetical protein HJC23_012730 [Cyclotella cryptica]|uniref:Uncharacterized protein n=1 Tax=Cyclotella cryptica TaxID=29204 RepID=A0ABD3NVL3_9STRA
MARATRSRGALAKLPTKTSIPSSTKSAVQKPVPKKSLSSKLAAAKKRGGGNSKSVRRALGDISNNNDDDTEPEDFGSDQDSVAASVDNYDVIVNAKKGRGDKALAQPNADDDNDDEEEVMSEQSDSNESDYEETTKKSTKRGAKKNAPAKKSVVGRKEQAKRVCSTENLGGKSRSKITRTKLPTFTSKKTQIFEDTPKIEDKDFSNLIGLVRKPEENSNFHADDNFEGGDWRCYGAVDY